MTAPRLPPAPTMPETTPSACGATNGTMPKWRPSAICTAMEKRAMQNMMSVKFAELRTQSGLLRSATTMKSAVVGMGISVSEPSWPMSHPCDGVAIDSEPHGMMCAVDVELILYMRIFGLPNAPHAVAIGCGTERAILAEFAVGRGHANGDETNNEAHQPLNGLSYPASP
eukprot:scaffold50094_cov30-Tisochrysis_lutea.AAC.1